MPALVGEPGDDLTIAVQLVAAAEDWARGRGFADLGSDTDLDNELSRQVHMKLGFEEASRTVTFRKRL